MSTFKLQQFSVVQQHSAMKVCTDTMIFGASLPITGGETVIDIGAGTGILSLMAAQQGASKVTAVEIDQETAKECADNLSNSRWHSILHCLHADILSRPLIEQVDRVICNPPFFDNHTASSDPLRRTARHTDYLDFQSLFTVATSLLKRDGIFCLLIPRPIVDRINTIAQSKQLQLTRRFDIQAKPSLDSKTSILWFSRSSHTPATPQHQTITVYDEDRQYSEQGVRYLKDYLLRFKDSNSSSPEDENLTPEN
ncbi:tRNA1(Val) (adenine(37)-N6)-methyltransferase [Sinobacterium norvegicum]|uniref:tRNA1(Val) (Adenine(37)-N6)-methyltransferase n=1 Tax=Sinobacterium norvegicum TaxID=1641715 RepID=A0ABM9AEP6_9GAMM|nr:methyltransferase [Sinobacterium norvegicum]CAH0991412.1 tRNA1(Val) (adenine(37)-N6)-methyltransferase [Sinobacterium norvegicum]